MDDTTRQWPIREGATVYAADGATLGTVSAVQGDYVVVEKGFVFPTDYYVPTGAIANMEGGDVYLSVAKEEALASTWGQVPSDYGERYEANATRVEQGDTLRVPVHEEELTAVTRPVEAGEVRIEKDVVAEERVLDVPVTEERVRVTRRAVDREAGADEAAFEGGTIAVPVRGEEVELQTRVRVAEEVEVGKEAVQRTERVAGTVRREEVRVEDRSDADVIAGDTGAAASGPSRRA